MDDPHAGAATGGIRLLDGMAFTGAADPFLATDLSAGVNLLDRPCRPLHPRIRVPAVSGAP
jgi:hypothetical protein